MSNFILALTSLAQSPLAVFFGLIAAMVIFTVVIVRILHLGDLS